MFGPNAVTRFALRFLLFYGLMLAAWPGVKDAYAVCFRACGNQLFGSFGSQGRVVYQPATTEGAQWDSKVVVVNSQRKGYAKMSCDSHKTGYLPTAMVVALVLATPTPWSRRWRALLWSLVLVNGFVVMRMALSLVWAFMQVSLYVFPPTWSGAVDFTHGVLYKLVLASWAVSALIWVLVTFRGSDLMQIPPHSPRKAKPI